jgi:hypothetical protein
MLIITLTGCAQKSADSPGGTNPGTTAPTAASPSSDCPLTLDVTLTDNGKTLCVGRGGTVTFDLGPEAASATSPLDVSGNALTQGQAEGTYAATNAGTATVTTERRNCPSPTPGTVSCHSIQLWKVTIQVK